MGILGGAFKFAGRTVVAGSFFGIGFSLFARAWPNIDNKEKLTDNRSITESMKIFNQIRHDKLFQKIYLNKHYKLLTPEQLIPEAHKKNHIGSGLLNSPNHLDVGPIILLDKEKGSMYSFCHLGSSLTGDDNKIHNGIISTLLDESLCFCGFDKLPSKRGVTAKLTIDFKNKAPPNSNIMLIANVTETKGRKCIIRGHVETIPAINSRDKPIHVADATCILVEPKWFKYFGWVDLF